VTWRDRPARPTVDLVPYPFPEPVRRRADIESFARELEARGRVRATVTRRLCTIAGFCKYAVEEELIDHSPAAHVRCPRVDYESRAAALDRNELGALLVAAGLGSLAATSAQYGPMHVI
jgi:site-specific recombinase XerD